MKDGGPRSIALEWSLSRGGHELVRRRKDVYGGGNWVGRFTASPGVYVLNLEVAGDYSHFLAGDSELEVYEAGDIRSAARDRVGRAFMVLFLLCPIATTVIVLEVRAQRRARERLLAMADSLTQPGPHIRDLPQGAPSLASLVPEELAPPPDGVAALLLIDRSRQQTRPHRPDRPSVEARTGRCDISGDPTAARPGGRLAAAARCTGRLEAGGLGKICRRC